jgi:hypothetical protein
MVKNENLVNNMYKEYYYHISVENWRKEKRLTPRIFGINRSDNEPDIARICVSPTIEGCLVALGACLSYEPNIYVYRTKNKVLGKRSYQVVDSHITGERWITRPVKFIKYGKIDISKLPESLFKLHTGNISDTYQQRKMFDILIRLNKKYLKRTK